MPRYLIEPPEGERIETDDEAVVAVYKNLVTHYDQPIRIVDTATGKRWDGQAWIED